MTRSIKAIYEDLITACLAVNADPARTLHPANFLAHTGDTQVLDPKFLSGIFDTLLQLADRSQKATTDEAYATEKNWIFDSGWYDGTSAQYTEIDDFRKNGYTTNSNRCRPRELFIDDSLSSLSEWFLEDSEFKQKELINRSSLIVGGKIFNHAPSKKVKDGFKYENLHDWSIGDFYDPKYKVPETLSELNDWLDVFDSILTSLKAGTERAPAASLTDDYPTSVQASTFSDILMGSVYYSIEFWSDDLTGEWGEIVRATLTGARNGGTLWTPRQVYSENLTVNIEDGEGGYYQMEYSTTDAHTGLSFGATAKTVFDYVASDEDDTFSGERIKYYYKKNSIDEDPPLGNYLEDILEMNQTYDTVATEEYSSVDDFYHVRNEPMYTMYRSAYIYDAFVSPSPNALDRVLFPLANAVKSPSVIGARYEVEGGDTYEVISGILKYPHLEHTVTKPDGNYRSYSNFVMARTYRNEFDGLDLTETTTHTLLPPE